MRRITLTGPELEGFAPAAPASYIKLIFPEPGQSEPTRPLPDGPRAEPAWFRAFALREGTRCGDRIHEVVS